MGSGVTIKFQNLDAALREALSRGWPDWRTTGQGGDLPRKKVHDFSYMKLRYGARIDCYRGEGFHDFKNIVWTNIKDKLPEFTKYMKNHQNPDSELGLGNTMEQAAGVSYAAATYGELLPEDGQLP